MALEAVGITEKLQHNIRIDIATARLLRSDLQILQRCPDRLGARFLSGFCFIPAQNKGFVVVFVVSVL